MERATIRSQVGVRDLKNNLSRYLEEVRSGAEIIVTEYGKPVARLGPIGAPASRLAELVAAGLVRAPLSQTRHHPRRRVTASAPLDDLVAEQRR